MSKSAKPYDTFIFVSDFMGEGDVMIFTHADKWTPESVEARIKEQGVSYEEVYAVPEDEIGYYIYEPVYM